MWKTVSAAAAGAALLGVVLLSPGCGSTGNYQDKNGYENQAPVAAAARYALSPPVSQPSPAASGQPVPAQSAQVAGLVAPPAPLVLATLTSYSGAAGPCTVAACVAARWYPQPGATFAWQVLDAASHVAASGSTTGDTAIATGLTPGATYMFRVTATAGGGSVSSAATITIDVCSDPGNPYFDPAVVAQTIIEDSSQTWLGWTNAYSGREFANTLDYTTMCTPGWTLTDLGYIQGENFNAPMQPGTDIWALAAP